jgi:hypothetical protein
MRNGLKKILQHPAIAQFFAIRTAWKPRQAFLDGVVFLRDPSRPSRIIAFFLG